MFYSFFRHFTIHMMPFDSIMVPLVYGLLPDKCQATYKRVLDLLHQEMGSRDLPFNVMRFCSDFEEGLRNALRSRFPDKTFCLFTYLFPINKHCSLSRLYTRRLLLPFWSMFALDGQATRPATGVQCEWWR